MKQFLILKLIIASIFLCENIALSQDSSNKATFFNEFGDTLEGKNNHLVSSVALAGKVIYPPGVPVVLKEMNRNFVIEQYYSKKPSDGELVALVKGPWYEGGAFSDQNLYLFKNRMLKIQNPRCEDELGQFGFRCLIAVAIDREALPSGVVEINIALKDSSGNLIYEPNSVTWIINPQDGERSKQEFKESELQHAGFIASASEHSETQKYVVQIAKNGNFSLGSGFFIKSLDPLRRMFPDALNSASEEDVYLMTVAHLFPSLALADGMNLTEKNHQRLVDLKINGITIQDAASILIDDQLADIAILRLEKSASLAVKDALGLTPFDKIVGFDWASEISTNSTMIVLGYPASMDGKLVQRIGYLEESAWQTDDTSNFGPLFKLKLSAMDRSQVDIAEAGMSGGPILNSNGEVVGIATERPIDTNSLIGVDVVNIEKAVEQASFQKVAISSSINLLEY